jgi:hypothetical protein
MIVVCQNIDPVLVCVCAISIGARRHAQRTQITSSPFD